MRTSTPEIRKAFYQRLLDALPLGPVTATDIAWPNFPFVADVKRLYLAPYCLFAATQEVTLSVTGFEQLRGVFQVTVYGVLNTGEAEIEEVARQLTDLYRAGTLLAPAGLPPVTVERSYRSTLFVSTGAGGGQPARPHIVVSADWRHFLQRGG